jgi:hypothetical protein
MCLAHHAFFVQLFDQALEEWGRPDAKSGVYLDGTDDITEAWAYIFGFAFGEQLDLQRVWQHG